MLNLNALSIVFLILAEMLNNGTWSYNDLQIQNQVVQFNTDFVHVLGNFISQSDSVLEWTIDLYSNKHGYLKVDKLCHLKGKAIFNIRSPVGEYNISIVGFSPMGNHTYDLELFDLKSEGLEPCENMNASLELIDNNLMLNLKVVYDTNCPPSANTLELKYIIIITVGSILGLIIIIVGIYLFYKRLKYFGTNKSLRKYIDEGYDDYRQEELEAFLSDNDNDN